MTEDALTECFGEQSDANQIGCNEEIRTKSTRPQDPFITEAAFQFSERRIGGERKPRRQSTRDSSALYPVSENVQKDQNTIPISLPEPTQAQFAAGMHDETVPHHLIHT